MAQFYTLLTDIGQAKLANAVALGSTIDISQLAIGDGGGTLPTPASSATALVNEIRRAPINTSTTDPDNPSWIVVEQILPPDIGGWTIREIGIIDADGDLIGIGNYPETYKPLLSEGSSRTQTVRFVLEVSDTSAITLKIDPSVVLATRQYVDQQDEKIWHAAQFVAFDAARIYTTGDIVRGSDGQFYEFYDRDQNGTTQGTDPTTAANRPHIWMRWDGTRPGATIEWRSETLPEGYLENNGSTISRADYRRILSAIGTAYGAGNGSTTFGLPDDRGEFKRGWDHGRGVDSGRSIASQQGDAIRNISGKFNGGQQNTSGNGAIKVNKDEVFDNQHVLKDGRWNEDGTKGNQFDSYEIDASLQVPTASENRPRNVAVIYLTKI